MRREKFRFNVSYLIAYKNKLFKREGLTSEQFEILFDLKFSNISFSIRKRLILRHLDLTYFSTLINLVTIVYLIEGGGISRGSRHSGRKIIK